VSVRAAVLRFAVMLVVGAPDPTLVREGNGRGDGERKMSVRRGVRMLVDAPTMSMQCRVVRHRFTVTGSWVLQSVRASDSHSPR
jgi:hypothetical protein